MGKHFNSWPKGMAKQLLKWGRGNFNKIGVSMDANKTSNAIELLL